MATLTSPVEGKDRGDTYSGDREAWLVANGYAAGDNVDGTHIAGVDASQDPTLAANREAPPAQGPDAYLYEDGEAVLSFERVEVVENDPSLYKAPLEHPTAHGTTDLNGVETAGDELSEEIQAGAKVVQEKAAEDDRLDATPQADLTDSLTKRQQAEDEADSVREASAAVLEAARTDIPESEANVAKSKAKASKKKAADSE